MLGINVVYIMKPGMRDQFLAEVTSCGAQQKVRRAAGCLQYDYFLSADDQDKLLLMEKWSSAEAQAAHLTQPHMVLIAAAKARCVLETKVETYQI